MGWSFRPEIRCSDTRAMSTKIFQKFDYLKIPLELNYAISAILLVSAALMPMIGEGSLFLDEEEIYGPLGNNLRLMGIYLALSDLLLWFYCFLKSDYSSLTFWGLFHLLIPNALQMYADVNDLPIEYESTKLFWYTGLSRIAFGLYMIKKRGSEEKTE